MKTPRQIREYAAQRAYDHFYCENGEVWYPFERFSEDDLEEAQESLEDVLYWAMLWAQEE